MAKWNVSTFGRSIQLSEPIRFKWLMTHEWVKDPFKVQDRPMDLTGTDYTIHDMVSISTLQLNLI